MKDLERELLYYDSAKRQLETWIYIFENEIKYLCPNSPIHYTAIRMKTAESILQKLSRKNLPLKKESLNELNDIVGARIVCDFIDNVYFLINKLKENKNINIIECRDYIKNPKDSGYRGYHLIIEIPISINGILKNVKAEIQVRTLAMDSWASNEHKLNYKKETQDITLHHTMRETADYIWQIDIFMNDIYRKSKES